MGSLTRFIVFWLALAMPVGAQEPKRPIAVDDLYRLDAPGAAVLDAAGKRAAFVRTWIDGATQSERHSLWIADQEGKARPLEEVEPDARAPVFSPDGRWIAFVSTRPRPSSWKQTPPVPRSSDAAVDIWLIPAAGGKAMPLGGPAQPHGRVFNDGFYGRLAFSPSGDKLAFIADDGADERTEAEKTGDLMVRADQGEGYTGYRPAQVWIAHLGAKPDDCAAAKIERLTKDDVWYGDPQWSADGTTLLVHANKTSDRESVRYSINKNFDIWSIDVASGKQRQMTFGPGPEVSPRFLPKGDGFVCLSIPRKGSHRDMFNLAVVTGGKERPTMRVVFDHHGKGADKPPHPVPYFPLPSECWDEGRLLYTSEIGVKTERCSVDLGTGKGHFLSFEEGKGMSKAEDRAWSLKKYLPAGNGFLKERLLAKSGVIEWTNEGMQIEGVLTLPPPEATKAPYKLILYPHGGPHGRSAPGFDFTVQVFAAHGYAVLQPNFRGSSGYGQKFIDADRFDLGGGDMRDCLAGIDELIRKEQVDPKQLYVFGSSYGGFMTTWLVGQTDRFKAAAAQNAVTDLNMMWGLTDIQSWTEWEMGGRPWEVAERMRKHSPLTYVDKVKTPTLILHARDDRRVPLPLGKAYHQALVSRGVPTGMVTYPDEGHGIRQPRHREDVLRRVLGWFEKWR